MCRRNETWRAVDPACWQGADKDFVDSQEGDQRMACASSQEEGQGQAPLLALFWFCALFWGSCVIFSGGCVLFQAACALFPTFDFLFFLTFFRILLPHFPSICL